LLCGGFRVGIVGFLDRVSVTFTVAFIVMLVLAAVALALGQEGLANELAEVAYYFLVIAVVSQLIVLVREGNSG